MQLNEITFSNVMQQLSQLRPFQRLLLAVGIWMLLLVVGLLVSWKSSVEASMTLDGNIKAAMSRLETQSQLITEGPLIQAELVQLETQLPVLKMALPSERELASLLGRINQLILERELVLVEYTPQAPINQEVMRRVPIKINLRGDGAVVSQLPNDLAELSRQVSLKKFEMSYLPESAGWQMTGELNAFAQLPPEEKKP